MAQIPQLVRPDLPVAPRTDDQLTTLDPAGKLAATALVLGAVQIALSAVV